jgi:hypothetical protein
MSCGRRDTPSKWVTVYDGPRRRATITAVTDHDWAGLRIDEAQSKPGEYTRWVCDGNGGPAVLELELDHRGIPKGAPDGFDFELMGSLTIWPRPDMHFVWWFAERPLFGSEERGQTSLQACARNLVR